MRAVPSPTNPAPGSTNRRNQVWGPWKSISLPHYLVCGCHPVLSTDSRCQGFIEGECRETFGLYGWDELSILAFTVLEEPRAAESRMSESEAGVLLDRLLEQCHGLHQVARPIEVVEQVLRTEIVSVRTAASPGFAANRQ